MKKDEGHKKKEIDDLTEPLERAEENLKEFDAIYPHDEIGLDKHVRDLVTPARAYYKKNFQTSENNAGEPVDGPYSMMRGGFIAAMIFDPTLVVGMDRNQISESIDDLASFGRGDLFTPELLKAMKAEIPKVLEKAGKLNDTFWMNHAPFKKWDADTKKRREREKQSAMKDKKERKEKMREWENSKTEAELYGRPIPDKPVFSPLPRKSARSEEGIYSWKDLPRERAERIFYWWGIVRKKLPSWATAVGHAVLFQPSSCFIERIFSILNLVIDACGHALSQEQIISRVWSIANENRLPDFGDFDFNNINDLVGDADDDDSDSNSDLSNSASGSDSSDSDTSDSDSSDSDSSDSD